jgi:PAS domain S-box-containing protein
MAPLTAHDSLKILIVDDDALDRRMVRRALKDGESSASITEVDSCAAMMAMLEEEQFDCIFLDYQLADGTALALLEKLRAQDIDTPVIVLSGHGDEQIVRELMKAGAADYLPKDIATSSYINRSLRSTLRFYQSELQAKHAVEALRLRDRAIASANNGIIICAVGPDFPIIYCNRAFERLTGYGDNEILGRSFRLLVGPESDQETVNEIARCLDQETECHQVLRNYRKDGSFFFNELTFSPVRDIEGRLSHYVVVCNDVTEQRRAEQENSRLLREVRDSMERERAFLRDVLSSATDGKLRLCHTRQELPTPMTEYGGYVSLQATSGIAEMRHIVRDTAITCGLPEERWQDLVTAVGEASMNAVVHGRGGFGRVYYKPGEMAQVWIEDKGTGISLMNLPRATLECGYTTAGTMGCGFSFILKTADRLWLLTGPTGTTLVIENDIAKPELPWLRE